MWVCEEIFHLFRRETWNTDIIFLWIMNCAYHFPSKTNQTRNSYSSGPRNQNVEGEEGSDIFTGFIPSEVLTCHACEKEGGARDMLVVKKSILVPGLLGCSASKGPQGGGGFAGHFRVFNLQNIWQEIMFCLRSNRYLLGWTIQAAPTEQDLCTLQEFRRAPRPFNMGVPPTPPPPAR